MFLLLPRSDRLSCLEVIREREKLYCLLRQTDPQGLRSPGPSWGIDPGTRYLSRQFPFNSSHVARLYRWVARHLMSSDTILCSGTWGLTLWTELTCSRMMRSPSCPGGGDLTHMTTRI